MTYLRLAGFAIGLAALIAAFFFGRHVGKAECEAMHLREEKKAADRLETRIVTAQQQDEKAVAADVVRETIMREITREIPKIVDRPVYRNVCIDADGVRLIRQAVDAANGRGAPGGGADGASGRVQPATGDRQP